MVIAIQAYYDGSGKSSDPNTRLLTLAGYAGTPNAWRLFEERWSRVLERYGCAYLHMREAQSLRGEFAKVKGWSEPKVKKLLDDLINECLTEVGWWQTKGEFYGASCTIDLQEYSKACKDKPFLSSINPEFICTNYVVNIAMMALPENKSKPFGKEGKIELFFDKGEPFMHTLDRIWREKPNQKLRGPLQLVSRITQVDMREVIGIQAADFLAWNTNRAYIGNPKHNFTQAKPNAVKSAITRILATPTYEAYYNYERLIKDKIL